MAAEHALAIEAPKPWDAQLNPSSGDPFVMRTNSSSGRSRPKFPSGFRNCTSLCSRPSVARERHERRAISQPVHCRTPGKFAVWWRDIATRRTVHTVTVHWSR